MLSLRNGRVFHLLEKGVWVLVCFRSQLLNGTRSSTTWLSRFTDEKELDPNPGRCGRAENPGSKYIQTIDEFEVHAGRPHVFRGLERFNSSPGGFGFGRSPGGKGKNELRLG